MDKQYTIYDYIEHPKRWKTEDHKAIEVLILHKYGHMVQMQYHNPSFNGCIIDDYTNAIDRAILALYKKVGYKMSNRDICKKALYEYIDSLDDDGIYELIVDQNIDGPGTFSCSECEKQYGTDRCNDKDICKNRFISWISS